MTDSDIASSAVAVAVVPAPQKNRLIIQIILGGIFLVPALVAICICLRRLQYPFDLDWLEGAILDHVVRVKQGALWVAPSAQFSPFPYTPLYYRLLSWLSPLIGISYTASRSLSLVSTIAGMMLLAAFTWHLTKNILCSCLAIGLFGALFRAGGAWFDMTRADNLAFTLAFAGIFLIWKQRYPVLAGILIVLAAYAKQTTLIFLFPSLLIALFQSPRMTIRIGVVAALFGAAIVMIENYFSHGWFIHYVYEVPRKHLMFFDAKTWKVFGEDMLHAGYLFPAVIFSFLFSSITVRNRIALGALLSGGLLYSFLSRANVGGWDNVLLPAYMSLSMTAAIGIWAALHNRPKLLAIFAVITLGSHCYLNRYSPTEQLPTSKDWCVARSLQSSVASLPGPTFSGSFGFLTYHAIRRTSVHESARWEIEATDTPNTEVLHAAESKFFTADKVPFLLAGITKPYRERYLSYGYVECALPFDLCTRTGLKMCLGTIAIHKDVFPHTSCKQITDHFKSSCTS